MAIFARQNKQGGIHGNPVADGWAGAVMQKMLGIQKCDGSSDRGTDIPTNLPKKAKGVHTIVNKSIRFRKKNKAGYTAIQSRTVGQEQ